MPESDCNKVKIFQSVSDIPEKIWDSLLTADDPPFFRWSWLNSLEKSGCVGKSTGILPLHFVLIQDNSPVMIAPMYLKFHSKGEFIFDYELANLAERLNLNYYPKLLGMSPFTPGIGYRFLSRPEFSNLQKDLLEEIDHFCLKYEIFGIHFLYNNNEFCNLPESVNYLRWNHTSPTWINKGFNDFEDFLLKSFSSKARKNIKRERKKISDNGINISAYSGKQITPELMKNMFNFYERTCEKFLFWGSKYLNLDFFLSIGESLDEHILLFAAHKNNSEQPIGMSMFIKNENGLWGRYWGCAEESEFLHFELCYYQGIEWSIRNKINFFDAGSGNSLHKRKRGFAPVEHSSLHKFNDEKFHEITRSYFEMTNTELKRQMINSQ